MNLTEIVSRISRTLQDPSFSEHDITERVNQIALHVAGLVDLPGLKKTASLTLPCQYEEEDEEGEPTGVIVSPVSVAMPSDFDRHLFYAATSTGSRIPVFQSFIEFLRRYGDAVMATEVSALSLQGATLHFRPVLSAEQVITIGYLSIPPVYDFDEDALEAPSFVPRSFHQGIFVNGALAELYALIEDGVGSDRANTLFHDAKFRQALSELTAYEWPEPDGIPEFIPDQEAYIDPW